MCCVKKKKRILYDRIEKPVHLETEGHGRTPSDDDCKKVISQSAETYILLYTTLYPMIGTGYDSVTIHKSHM